jgi:AbrB family looped-hinge helix DNA binding protein
MLRAACSAPSTFIAELERSAKIKLDLVIVRDTVIRMETVTISPKFQIVIPQRIREAMGLRSGEKARMLSFRNRIEVIPVRDIRSLRGYLKGIDTSFVRDGDRV